MRETRWRIWRRTALGLVACALALTWAQSGMTQDCVVVRGQDPFDVLQTTVRHNVWLILDRSGSMGGPFDPAASTSGDCPIGPSGLAANSRMCESVQVIQELLTEFVDAEGEPLVNWGYSHFVGNNRSPSGITWVGNNVAATDPNNSFRDRGFLDGDETGSLQRNPFLDCTTGYCGGLVDDIITPPTCQASSNVSAIESRMLNLTPFNNGFTPLGISLEQLAEHINTVAPPSSLYPGQRNYIIFLTDGWDTCECRGALDDNLTSGMLRGGQVDPTPNITLNVPPRPPRSVACDSDGDIEADGQDDIDQAQIRAYNSGLEAEQAFKLIHGNTAPYDGSKGDIFIIGMGVQRDDCFTNDTIFESILNHIAWKGSGIDLSRTDAHGALFARSGRTELKEALLDVLGKIGVPSTEVTLGPPVVGSVKELMYLTDETGAQHPADFEAAGGGDISTINLRNQFRNNILFTTSAETPGFRGHFRAFNVFTVAADGTRTADFSDAVWDAGEMLQARDPDDRRIYFNRDVPVGTDPPDPLTFDSTNVLPADLGVSAGFLSDIDPTGVGAETAADAAAIVIGVIRGKRLVISETTGLYDGSGNLNLVDTMLDGSNTWKLYETTSSPAIVLNPSRSASIDPPQPVAEYQAFFGDRINRLTIAYLATNGGVMHAFRADNGYELYAYIPADALSKLSTFVEKVVSDTNGIANHVFFMATSPTVEDAFLQPGPDDVSEWRTVLAFGRGRGGKFVSALDVSGSGTWDGQAAAAEAPSDFEVPKLLFTVGNRDGVADLDASGEADNNYDGMGETWSLMAMGRVRSDDANGQWVAFFGGGYGCTASDEGKFLYVLKLEDGSIYAKLGPIQDAVGPSDVGIDDNALVASPALYNPHVPGFNDGLDFVTRAYIGDLQGFVYKLDAEDPDPANWEFDVLFEITSEADQAEGQGEHNQPITARASIIKLSTSPEVLVFVGTGGDQRVQLQEPDRFKIVGIVDDGSFDGQLYVPVDGEPTFFDLPEGERVSVAPIAARNSSTDGVVFFASSRFEFDEQTCSGGFASTLTAVGVNGGLGSFDMDPSLTGNQGQIDLGQGKVTGLYHRDEHLYVSMSGGIGFPSQTQVLGSDTFSPPAVGSSNLQLLVESFRMSPF